MIDWLFPRSSSPVRGSVLVLGIYLADKRNAADHIVKELCSTKGYSVTQRWAAINGRHRSGRVEKATALHITGRVPKFELLNKLLQGVQVSDYDYIVVCDDDIHLPRHFLDRYLALQSRYDLALAQPARTHNSYIDHPFVQRIDTITARQTSFVEIGPVFSLRSDIFSLLLPFDERPPMGWGLDFVWPALLKQHEFRLGIIDAVPVDHSLRKPWTVYDGGKAKSAMDDYLDTQEHVSAGEAFVILERYE